MLIIQSPEMATFHKEEKEELMILWCFSYPRLFGINVRSRVTDIALR
ncbi:hypothetical protein [Vibrio gallaecicus]|nr:hypothetical protein [Vibrio gallaecicus]MDN3616820.1 hypothetical protein [Vibrio gallaecicus]